MERKVRIPYNRKKDLSMINEEIQKIVSTTFHQLDEKQTSFNHQEFKLFKKTAERRVNEFIGSFNETFRNHVEYCKSKEEKVKKVIAESDTNLVNINNVKVEMLKKSIIAGKQLNSESIPIEIKYKKPDNLVIEDSENQHTLSEEAKNRVEAMKSQTANERLANYEKLLQKTLQRIIERDEKEQLQNRRN